MTIVGSLSGLLNGAEGSAENLGGSIGDLLGLGVGSLAENVQPLIDALAAGSDRGADAGK